MCDELLAGAHGEKAININDVCIIQLKHHSLSLSLSLLLVFHSILCFSC